MICEWCLYPLHYPDNVGRDHDEQNCECECRKGMPSVDDEIKEILKGLK